MKITKYEHACWDITENNTRVLIDPGEFSKSLSDISNINALVLTHIHTDHFDKNLVNKIIAENPSIQIFITSQVANEVEGQVTVPKIQQTYAVNDITLEFFGGDHELFEGVENIAVLINEKFFCPGDSYTQPDRRVAFAAVPASAPWLRITEASENIRTIQADIVAPTHNALLSEIGEAIHYRILSGVAKESGKEWRVLKVGESIEF